jgi:hypothetical protein
MDAFIPDYLAPLMDSRAWARALILGGIALGLWLGLARTSLDRRQRTTTWLAVILPLLTWYLVIWQFARTGGFQAGPADGSPPLPLVPMAIFLPLLIALPLLIRSKRIGAVLDAVSPAWLVGFQVYRVLGYVFLVRWAAGELPGVFALPAGTGDVLVGALALPVAFYLQSGAVGGRAAAYAWNVLGILDLLVAVTLGALTATGRLPVDVPNVAASSFPLVMIPAFAVPLSLILHGVSLWQLIRRTRAAASTLSAQPMPGSL